MTEPIKLVTRTLTGTTDGPHLLILGGVHGDEFESMAAIRRLIRELDTDKLCGQVTVVPVVNEAAYWHGQRCAEDGLDLARTCPGRPDGSVTERVAVAVSKLIGSVDYLIDLHSGGLVMRMGPMAGYVLHSDPAVLEVQRRMCRAFNMPLIWGTAANLDGRTLSVARDANVPAIYAEWLGAGECDPAGVEAYFEGCLNVMGELEMIKHSAPPSVVEFVVEDDRTGSGHVQLHYPAPFGGFFEPAVELRQVVEVGQPLGQVCDHLGDRSETIVSQEHGVVICLRALNRVLEGDSVVAIMELLPGQESNLDN